MNTNSAVIPHAFYRPGQSPCNKSIHEVSRSNIKSDIKGHLTGRYVKSHFSSWAADFQTAINYAGVGTDAHLAVFDTSLRGQYNEIYHVPALHSIGLAPSTYPHEYLVFGIVHGESYASVPVTKLRKHGMDMTLRFPKGTPEVSADDLTRASKIAEVFRASSQVMGPDLFLTVFAAELSRLLRTDRGHNCAPGWSQMDNSAILDHVSETVDLAAKLPSKKSLVNPKTYVEGFPQLKAMVDVLMTVQLGIDKKRSELSKASAHKTNSLPPPGQKRKADDSQVSTDSKVVGVEMQKAHPRDLLEELVKRGGTWQKELRISREKLDAQGPKVQELRTKLVATENSMNVLSIDPKRNTVSTAMLHMEKAASDLDRLAKKSQVFSAELQLVEASLGVLQQSCNEIIKSIGKEADPFIRQCPQESGHETTLPRPSDSPEAKAVEQRDYNSSNPTKRMRKHVRSYEARVVALLKMPEIARLRRREQVKSVQV